MFVASLLLTLAQAGDGVSRVFFDWDKAEISRDSEATLDTFAEGFRANPGQLVVTGHSDRSGPAGANRIASRNRAQLVADYLAAKGVPRSAMTIEGRGEETPLIATEDGVREVQNRRVEIRRR